MYSRRTGIFCCLAGSILWAGLLANAASAEEADAMALLKKMSASISAMKSFVVRGEVYADERLDAGLIIEHSSEVTMRVRRPDAMRLTMRDASGVKELYFADGVLTFYNGEDNFYAQTDSPGSISEAADFSVHTVGIDAPMLDFLATSVAERLEKNAQEIQHLGTALMRGKAYQQVAIRLAEIDVQIWIAAEGKPLPGKMTLSAKWKGGAPRTVMFFDWDTAPDLPSGSLQFIPPKEASPIEFALDP